MKPATSELNRPSTLQPGELRLEKQNSSTYSSLQPVKTLNTLTSESVPTERKSDERRAITMKPVSPDLITLGMPRNKIEVEFSLEELKFEFFSFYM